MMSEPIRSARPPARIGWDASRISYYLDARQFEWFAVRIMFLMALEIVLGPATMHAASLQRLAQAVHAQDVGVFFLLIAAARCGALIANGRSSVYGPRVRAFGALAGAIIWAEM